MMVQKHLRPSLRNTIIESSPSINQGKTRTVSWISSFDTVWKT